MGGEVKVGNQTFGSTGSSSWINAVEDDEREYGGGKNGFLDGVTYVKARSQPIKEQCRLTQNNMAHGSLQLSLDSNSPRIFPTSSLIAAIPLDISTKKNSSFGIKAPYLTPLRSLHSQNL